MIDLVRTGELSIDRSGRIWRHLLRTGLKTGGAHIVRIKKRRAERMGSAYFQVCAMRYGRRIHSCASRLVWQHFRGNISPGLCINHKNGIKTDNRLSNLELCTYSENLLHAFRNGLARSQSGEKNPAAVLTNKQVVEIRRLYSSGDILQINLADRFSVSFQTISKIIRGERRSKQAGAVSLIDHRHPPPIDPKTGRFLSKKAAGRLLDGRTWDEYPKAK